MFSTLSSLYRLSALRLAIGLTFVFVLLLGLVWVITGLLIREELEARIETSLSALALEIHQGEFETVDSLSEDDEDQLLWGVARDLHGSSLTGRGSPVRGNWRFWRQI